MAANWATLLGLLVILLLARPLTGDIITIVKTVLVMGAVSAALKIISINTITNWATGANAAIGATAIGGTLVFVALNYVIQQSDVPFLSDNVEKIIRYVFYVLGGVLMAGATQWNQLFVDVIGLLKGGPETNGLIGIARGLLEILLLGLAGS